MKMKRNPKPNSRPKWYTSHTQNRQPPQWCPSSPFIAQGGKAVYKKGETNIPFHSMGIFPLILGEVRMMGLNSHLFTNYYVPMYNLAPLSLPRVDVRARAHRLYILRILSCISSTIRFTLIIVNKLQIYKVYVQRCTSHLCSLRSVFRLWTKIFTTSAPT